MDGVLFATAFGTCTFPASGIFGHTELFPTLFAIYSFRQVASADSIAVCAVFGTLGMVKAVRIRSTDLAT